MSWTINELADFFNKKNIPADLYSFYSEKDDAFCIEKTHDEWLVYYSERGQKNELGWAKNEAQALGLLKLFVLEAHRGM